MTGKLKRIILCCLAIVSFFIIIIVGVTQLGLVHKEYTPIIAINDNISEISKQEAETIAKNYIERLDYDQLGYNPTELKSVSSCFMSDNNWHVNFKEDSDTLCSGLNVVINEKTQEPVGYNVNGCRYFYKTDTQGNVLSTVDLNDQGAFFAG